MPLHLIPPGKRKNNRFFIARGRIGDDDFEVNTHTTDPLAAEKFAAEFTVAAIKGHLPGPGAAVTFAQAADAYAAYRNPGKDELRRIDRLKADLGAKLLTELTPHSFVDAANRLYPSSIPSSRNRSVITPARFIMHYAAEQLWCPYMRIKGFKERKAVTRAVDEITAATLIQSARADLRLLLLVLFKQGFRISDALKIEWERGVDLVRGVLWLRIGKTDEWREFPMDDEVRDELGAMPERLRTGHLFPWRSRWRVYDALAPLCQKLGVKFTPHMARHSLGTWLNERGEGLKTIMAALGHEDPKSSVRYQAGDIKIVRAAQQRLGKVLGKKHSTT